MPAPNPITQRDVAEACGLHPSTVCLALKNSPSIPGETRRKIQAAAAQLGYQPNAAARNLALLRSDRKMASSLPIAWINQEAKPDHWRAEPQARTYFESARRRAAEAGYHLEEIWTREPGMNADRIVHILRARGIDGVIFPAHRSFDFSLLNSNWGAFSMVGLNDHRLSEWIDLISPDHHRNTRTAFHQLLARGFGRIGLVLTSQFDAATAGLVHACFLREQSQLSPAERLPAFFAGTPHGSNDCGMTEWLKEHQPEVVICHADSLPSSVRESAKIPWVELQGATKGFAAWVDACPGEIAAAAVDSVVEKMRRFERGLRESTRLHLIKGVWQEGSLTEREMQSVVA